MPRDGFRSAMFRFFVKCHDPKGVVVYKTMRKSKTSSKRLKGVSETKSSTNDLNACPKYAVKEEKIDIETSTQEKVTPISLQVKEVSKGAHELNQVIETYSNGEMRFNHHSKEIANDLSKGGSDLPESLMVLGKLQEASQYMPQFQKKPKDKTKYGQCEQKIMTERSKSDRYADHNDKIGLKKSRSCVDVSSRNCYDGLRTVIRDSLTKQTLLPQHFHEKPSLPGVDMLDSMVGIPSTSSTQSSANNFISYASSDSSFSSEGLKRSKGSNLILKLMGIEEIPTQQGCICSPKSFEIEMISAHKITEEQKLTEIVETMQYKRLLNAKWDKESTNQPYSDSKSSTKVTIKDDPRIVIMKPNYVSMEEPKDNGVRRLIQKMGMKNENKGTVNFEEVSRRLRVEVSPMRKQRFNEFQEKELSNKLKASHSVDQKDKKKKIERMDKACKPKTKLGTMSHMRLTALLSHHESKVSSMEKRKTETEPISRLRSFLSQKSAPLVISKSKLTLFRKGSDTNNNLKLVMEPLMVRDMDHKRGVKQIDRSNKDERSEVFPSTTTAARHFAKEEIDATIDRINATIKLKRIAKWDKEATNINKFHEKEVKRRKLFFSSPSFLTHAKELFNTETNFQTIQPLVMSSIDPKFADTRLFPDVVNELMLQTKLSIQSVTLKNSVSLAQLVEEVCKGLDYLSKYNTNGNEKLMMKTIDSVLKRDMLGTGLTNGTWELGWKQGYFFGEVEQLVTVIENLVFSELIECILTEFSLLSS